MGPVMGSPSLNATSIGVCAVGQRFPRGSVGLRSGVLRGGRHQAGHRARSGAIGVVGKWCVVSCAGVFGHRALAAGLDERADVNLGADPEWLHGSATRSRALADRRWAVRCWRRRPVRSGPDARQPLVGRSDRPSPDRRVRPVAGPARRTPAYHRFDASCISVVLDPGGFCSDGRNRPGRGQITR